MRIFAWPLAVALALILGSAALLGLVVHSGPSGGGAAQAGLPTNVGDDYEIQTTATQSTTGALAHGRIEGRCSGRTDQYQAPTWVYDEALFEPGPAQVFGLLITRNGGKVSDVFQWCRKENVDLQPTNAS